MISQERLLALLDKYTRNSISEEERTELFYYIDTGEYDHLVTQHIEQNLEDRTVAGANLPPHRSAEIVHKVLLSEKQAAQITPARIGKTIRMRRLTAAAVLLCVVATAAYFIYNRPGRATRDGMIIAAGMDEKTNPTGQPQKLQMEDGSFVILQPGSRIDYPYHFKADKREIYLQGEAFFDVSKDPNRPFYVYSNDIVTHVLGTSFNVKRDPLTQQLEVAVRTGKVEVYESRKTENTTAGNKSNGVILLPNQKVIYDEHNQQFVPSLVDNPLPVMQDSGKSKAPAESFVFEEARLSDVLTAISKVYKIEMEVESENIYNCLFTGDVTKQGLYAKLDIICESIHASYEIKGTSILIKGKGCQ